MPAQLPKRFAETARPALRRYQKILADARARDVNESDTVVIVSDMLCDVLGYDKYQEVTTELAIRSTYCDLAIKCENRLCYLIEVKSIGTELKETHIRQAVDYGTKEGCDWVLLTTGAIWRAYRIKYEQPIDYELAFTIDLLDPAGTSAETLELLYLLSRGCSGGKEIDRFWQQKEATSRYVLAQLLLGDAMLAALRREVRRLAPEVKVTTQDLAKVLQGELLKRDALDGEKAAAAAKVVRRGSRRALRRAAATSAPLGVSAAAPTVAASRTGAANA